MSEVIVAKAGGTSNATAAAVEQSLGWAEQSDIFVVSAPGVLDGDNTKVTDMLLKAHKRYAATGEVSGSYLEGIAERYRAITEGLDTGSLQPQWIDKVATRIESAVHQGQDATSMLGERLQAEIYESQGFILLDPGRSPHSLGSDPEAWRGWLSQVVKKGNRYVLPGNTTLNEGYLKTFSRGGSDTSGGLAAYGAGADLHLNLTDNGVLSANPDYFKYKDENKEIKDERYRLRGVYHLLYEEGRELGRNGTGLLHPAAMVPLMMGDIPTHIRSTFNRHAPGTEVDNDRERAAQRAGEVVALSLMRNVKVHRVHEPGMAEAVGRLADFETALGVHGIPLIDTQGDGVDGQKYFVGNGQADEARAVLEDVTHGEVESTDNLSLITLVGYRLAAGVMDNIQRLVSKSGIDIHAWQNGEHDFSTGRHSLRISVDSDPQDDRHDQALIRTIHGAFIEKIA